MTAGLAVDFKGSAEPLEAGGIVAPAKNRNLGHKQKFGVSWPGHPRFCKAKFRPFSSSGPKASASSIREWRGGALPVLLLGWSGGSFKPPASDPKASEDPKPARGHNRNPKSPKTIDAISSQASDRSRAF